MRQIDETGRLLPKGSEGLEITDARVRVVKETAKGMLRKLQERQSKYEDDWMKMSLLSLLVVFTEEVLELSEACAKIGHQSDNLHELFEAARDECSDVAIMAGFIRDKLDFMEAEWLREQTKDDDEYRGG